MRAIETRAIVFALTTALLVAGLGCSATEPGDSSPPPDDASFRACRALGRGMNLGDDLDAPSEGAWGVKLEADYFEQVKWAGFQSVRIPIRWSAHAQAAPPYAIDPAFFKRVDWAIEQALSRQLMAVINVHHYEEMATAPEEHLPRLKAIWRQVAERYRDRPEQLLFELMNEPNGKLTTRLWQQMFPELLAEIRPTNPQRIVIIGPGMWNNIYQLSSFQLPADDRNLIATVHYYEPFHFTHQGASWMEGAMGWMGTTWRGTPAELAALRKDLGTAAAWGRKHQRPLYVGEFGAFNAADMTSRAAWTSAVAREAEKLGMAWSYWEFCNHFAAYDRATHSWHQPLLDALLDRNR